MNQEHVDAVLNDLVKRKNALMEEIRELEAAIKGVRSLYQVSSEPSRSTVIKKEGVINPVVRSIQPLDIPTVSKNTLSSALKSLKDEVKEKIKKVEEAEDMPVVKKQPPTVVPAPGVEERVSTINRNSYTETCVSLILKYAAESRYNQTQLVAKVLCHRPGASSASINTQLYSMLRANEVHKGTDLVIRAVKDGRIQGLPDLPRNSVGFPVE